MDLYEDDGVIRVPAGSVRFPIELRPPTGFRPADPGTWPKMPGRLEYVEGRLLFMPPCGDVQQDVSVGVIGVFDHWMETHPEFRVGANEAGMILGEDVRGAEVAVWRREAVGPYTGGYRRVPPILAVEVAGRDEGEPELRQKARWYLAHGVRVVWIVLPESCEVIVLNPDGESRHRPGETLPPHPELPGLAPQVAHFFRRLTR